MENAKMISSIVDELLAMRKKFIDDMAEYDSVRNEVKERRKSQRDFKISVKELDKFNLSYLKSNPFLETLTEGEVFVILFRYKDVSQFVRLRNNISRVFESYAYTTMREYVKTAKYCLKHSGSKKKTRSAGNFDPSYPLCGPKGSLHFAYH